MNLLHISVSLKNRNPNWDEMCFVKEKLLGDEMPAVQFHPPRSEYVNERTRALSAHLGLGGFFRTVAPDGTKRLLETEMNTQKRFVESTSIELTHADDWDEYAWQDGDQILIELYDPESETYMHIVALYMEIYGQFEVLDSDGAFGLSLLDEMYPDVEVTAWQPISTSRRVL